jgi:hypothetical protein
MRLGHTLESLVQAPAVLIEGEERAVYKRAARARPIDNSSPFLLDRASMSTVLGPV